MTLQTERTVFEPAYADVLLRLSVDPVLFTLANDRLHVLLRCRTWQPFEGVWALPGIINPPNEQLEETMLRELRRMDLADIWIEQLKTFDRPPQYVGGTLSLPGRDPRGRVISVAYLGLVSPDRYATVSNDAGIAWTPADDLPELAFDHREIIQYAIWRLRNKIAYSAIAFQLLPPQFTLTQLQKVYEMVLGTQLDKRNFRRKVLDSVVVEPTGSVSRSGTRRPARLYHFAQREFQFG